MLFEVVFRKGGVKIPHQCADVQPRSLKIFHSLIFHEMKTNNQLHLRRCNMIFQWSILGQGVLYSISSSNRDVNLIMEWLISSKVSSDTDSLMFHKSDNFGVNKTHVAYISHTTRRTMCSLFCRTLQTNNFYWEPLGLAIQCTTKRTSTIKSRNKWTTKVLEQRKEKSVSYISFDGVVQLN